MVKQCRPLTEALFSSFIQVDIASSLHFFNRWVEEFFVLHTCLECRVTAPSEMDEGEEERVKKKEFILSLSLSRHEINQMMIIKSID